MKLQRLTAGIIVPSSIIVLFLFLGIKIYFQTFENLLFYISFLPTIFIIIFKILVQGNFFINTVLIYKRVKNVCFPTHS